MTAKKQAAILEVIGGIFGWIWILASVFLLVFLAGAIFSDWNWWNVGYALIVGALAKWLAKGFNEHRDGALLEASLIEKGIDAAEAREIRKKRIIEGS